MAFAIAYRPVAATPGAPFWVFDVGEAILDEVEESWCITCRISYAIREYITKWLDLPSGI